MNFERIKKNKVLWLTLATFFLIGVVACAEVPVKNINPNRHPNLAEAQELSYLAFEKIEQAQRVNEWDMEGHAQRAKDLLVQVNLELKLAAEEANVNRRR